MKGLVVTREELQRRLSLPLDQKISHFVKVFVEYFCEYDGHVYQACSGGKDSQVASDIIDKIWDGTFKHYLPPPIWEYVVSLPKPPKAFCNTGLEFPEIVEHVKTFEDVVFLKPKMGFKKVLLEYGAAVGSKKIATLVERLRKYIENPSDKNRNTRRLYEHGIRSDGVRSSSSKVPDIWKPLLYAPFKISNKCCDVFKKDPFIEYEKKTGRKPIYFTTTEESANRTIAYYKTGCNSFERGKEACRPYSIFTEKDTWEYHDKYGLRFCSVYYDRTVDVEQLDGTVKKMNLKAEKRTGCVVCAFGVHLEPKEVNNRIQRLGISHPKLWHAFLINCGLGRILRYCGIPYEPKREPCKQLEMFES